MNDPFVGTLTFARVYSGKLEKGGYLNSVKDKKEKIGRMLLMHANAREDIDEAFAGDIVAIAGLKETTTGDPLCDPQHPIILERMEIGRASCRKECVRTCSSRCEPYHSKNKTYQKKP